MTQTTDGVCENCGCEIAPGDRSYVWDNHVICFGCNWNLKLATNPLARLILKGFEPVLLVVLALSVWFFWGRPLYVAGITCILWGIAQLRPTLGYLGFIPSGLPLHIQFACWTAIAFVFWEVVGITCFFVPWPQIIIWAMIYRYLRHVAVELVNLRVNAAGFGRWDEMLTEKGKHIALRNKWIRELIGASMWFGVVAVLLVKFGFWGR
jgi:hypothetical protein